MNKSRKPENSSMVSSLEELKKHSKVMEQMETNKELKKSHLTPDPKQFQEKDHS
ncbi:hypothetical protein [Bacillus pinisoli]|uniref:hypothetical protein n=1 Tax=Bacillus pinisoli TaxID=2901866 RepID=UPI001FF6A8CD|nr:hypothetical protein [Bacillus pinisoli]